MFGIGMPEMLLILAVALIVIGPKKLPDLAKSLGRAMGEFKKATNELKDSLQIDDELKSVKSSFNDLNRELKGKPSVSSASAKKEADGNKKTEPANENDSADKDQDPIDKVKAAFDKNDVAPEPDPPTPEDNSQPASDPSSAEAAPDKAL